MLKSFLYNRALGLAMIQHLQGNHESCPVAGEGKCAEGQEWELLGYTCKSLRPDERSQAANHREAKYSKLTCAKSIAYLTDLVKDYASRDSIMFYGISLAASQLLSLHVSVTYKLFTSL